MLLRVQKLLLLQLGKQHGGVSHGSHPRHQEVGGE